MTCREGESGNVHKEEQMSCRHVYSHFSTEDDVASRDGLHSGPLGELLLNSHLSSQQEEFLSATKHENYRLLIVRMSPRTETHEKFLFGGPHCPWEATVPHSFSISAMIWLSKDLYTCNVLGTAYGAPPVTYAELCSSGHFYLKILVN